MLVLSARQRVAWVNYFCFILGFLSFFKTSVLQADDRVQFNYNGNNRINKHFHLQIVSLIT